MKLLNVLDYAEAHPDEWFAQIIENAWSEEDVRKFAKETRQSDFERIRQARNEQHAAATWF
jgi:hypothetical protein